MSVIYIMYHPWSWQWKGIITWRYTKRIVKYALLLICTINTTLDWVFFTSKTCGKTINWYNLRTNALNIHWHYGPHEDVWIWNCICTTCSHTHTHMSSHVNHGDIRMEYHHRSMLDCDVLCSTFQLQRSACWFKTGVTCFERVNNHTDFSWYTSIWMFPKIGFFSQIIHFQ